MERRILSSGVGRRRKALMGGALAVLLGAALLPVISTTGAAAGTVPSDDINDYVLYAYSTLHIKRGSVDGNIAAGTKHWTPPSGCTVPAPYDPNEYTASSNFLKAMSCQSSEYPASSGDAHVSLCQGTDFNNRLDMPLDSYIVAPSVDINLASAYCRVQKAYTLKQLGSARRGIVETSFTPPDIVMPQLPAFSCTGAKALNTATPNPGTWTVSSTSEISSLTLKSGTYNFCGTGLTIAQGGTFVTQPDTIVNVNGKLWFKGGTASTQWLGTQGDNVQASRFNVKGALSFGRNARVKGVFFAPNADVDLGNGTVAKGRVWAYSMHSDWDFSIENPPPPPPPPTTTTTTSKSTSTSTSTTSTSTSTTSTSTSTTSTSTTTTSTSTSTTSTTIPKTTTTTVGGTTTTTIQF
jgi:hypothetical protein